MPCMEIFEVHITGDESIVTVAPVKTIAVDLLLPDQSHLRTEYMTSQVYKFPSYQECKQHVDLLVSQLIALGVQIKRVKIESPIYDHYIKDSLYIESHFPATDWDYPVSRNLRKTAKLATDRDYNQDKYKEFQEKHAGRELELCLYDKSLQEDLDWLSVYKTWNSSIG